MIHFLLELFLGGSQDAELLVLGLQVVLSQATLLGLLLDLQGQVLHLKGRQRCELVCMYISVYQLIVEIHLHYNINRTVFQVSVWIIYFYFHDFIGYLCFCYCLYFLFL